MEALRRVSVWSEYLFHKQVFNFVFYIYGLYKNIIEGKYVYRKQKTFFWFFWIFFFGSLYLFLCHI